jgi:uncharacterized protein YcbK (DUF882 family)
MCQGCNSLRIGRRAFIAGGLSVAASLAMPRLSLADGLPASSRWNLWLERYDTGEQAYAPFTLDGRSLYFEGYKQLCAVLRDDHVPIHRGWVKIPIKTVEVLWSVQQYLARAGFNAPLVVHSGYRTPETNAATEGAAWNSFHMYGRAVDFHVDGVGTDELADICYSCPDGGGVGSYAGGWVHLDTGPKRTWTG